MPVRYLLSVRRHGTYAERVYRLEFVSNQDFTDAEFFKWAEAFLSTPERKTTRDQIEQKLKDLKEALTYRPKEDDITKV